MIKQYLHKNKTNLTAIILSGFLVLVAIFGFMLKSTALTARADMAEDYWQDPNTIGFNSAQSYTTYYNFNLKLFTNDTEGFVWCSLFDAVMEHNSVFSFALCIQSPSGNNSTFFSDNLISYCLGDSGAKGLCLG